MNTTSKTTLASLFVAAFGLLVASGPAFAQRFDPRDIPPFGPQRFDPSRYQRRDNRDFDEIHRAARAIEKNAHDLHEEVDDHFRPSPAYSHLHRHTRDIERQARTIHAIADSTGNRRLLRQAVERLDDEVHHFVEVVEDSQRFRNIPPRAYAHLREEVRQLHRAVVALKRELD
jgi:hypothetical protein